MTEFEKWWAVQDHPNKDEEVAKAAWDAASSVVADNMIEAFIKAAREKI